MKITERRMQGTTVLELHGTLTSPAAYELLDATVRRVTRENSPRLVLDLGSVPSIDAAGLGALVAAYGVARRHGGTFRLAHVAPRVLTLLIVCRLVTVFETFDAVEDAVAAGPGGSPLRIDDPGSGDRIARLRTERAFGRGDDFEARSREPGASLEESW